MTERASSRRIGTTDSKTRSKLLDAAEQLLLEAGYAAVTSRAIGTKAGLKPQLVHYYFRTMDELFIEIYRRRAERYMAEFESSIAADGSLRNLWRLTADSRGTVFTMEFVGLVRHRPAIRAEIAHYAERFRAAQLTALTAALARSGVSTEQFPPEAALLLMSGAAYVLAGERSLGLSQGHASTILLIERIIDQLEQRQP